MNELKVDQLVLVMLSSSSSLILELKHLTTLCLLKSFKMIKNPPVDVLFRSGQRASRDAERNGLITI